LGTAVLLGDLRHVEDRSDNAGALLTGASSRMPHVGLAQPQAFDFLALSWWIERMP